MGVYHITYAPGLKEVCLYFDSSCNFSCHGCITKFHPEDYHLDKSLRQSKKRTLLKKGVMFYLKPFSFNRVIFLGLEPTIDSDFFQLAQNLKRQFSTYNILLTNGYNYVKDKAINEVCVSIKAITPSVFKDFTSKSDPGKVLENFKRYFANYILRAESVFIPGYIDIDETEKIAHFIGSVNFEIPYRIDGYISAKKVERFRSPTEDEMREVKEVAERYLKNVSVLHHQVSVKHKVVRIY